MVDPADTVRSYHRQSTHHPNRYAPGPHGLDWANQPDPFRCFAGAAQVTLPLAAHRLATTYDALYRDAVEPSAIGLESIAALFQLSLGISAWKAYGTSKWALRCNPSSGNLHPTEGYVAGHGLPGLAAGVYHYVSRDHVLEHRAAPLQGDWQVLPADGLVVGLSSIYWREAWKYGMRAYRYCQHDCGHAIAALRYAAAALGWRAILLDHCGDDDIAALLGLDRAADFTDAEAETPEALLWIGPGCASPDIESLVAQVRGAQWFGKANRLSANHVRWEMIARVDQAARKPRTPPLPTIQPAALPAIAATAAGMAAPTLFLQRRSAVDFDAVTGCSGAAFFRMLDALLPRTGIPVWDALPWTPQVHLGLFVHRVHGVAPGLYILARDPSALPWLRAKLRRDWVWEAVQDCPKHLPLRLLVEADVRDEARTIACHQDIAADSVFSLGMLARFGDNLERGAWRYRWLHWEAGILGHVLYLEAEAAGLRATGIGCFFDDEMHRLMGIEDETLRTLYHFTVGGAIDDPRLTTLPPYAHLESERGLAR
ncbi:MAG: SagB/ThcOx family dehydrogenase [Burkholderiales bacterium]